MPYCFTERGCPLAFEGKDREGKPIPCENLALDEKLSEQVQLLKIILGIHGSTMDAQVLKEPFTEMGLYQDILSYAEILITWSKYTRMNQPQTDSGN